MEEKKYLLLYPTIHPYGLSRVIRVIHEGYAHQISILHALLAPLVEPAEEFAVPED